MEKIARFSKSVVLKGSTNWIAEYAGFYRVNREEDKELKLEDTPDIPLGYWYSQDHLFG